MRLHSYRINIDKKVLNFFFVLYDQYVNYEVICADTYEFKFC
jgi:hypothetical protein